MTIYSSEPLRPLGSSPRNLWHVARTRADLVREPVSARPILIEAGARQVRIDLARTAILVIDMQNDFCHPDGWLGHIGVDVAPVRAPIAPLARLLPALRGADVPVLWVNWGNRPDRLNLSPSLLHVYKPEGLGIGLGDPLPGSGAKVLEQDSWAAAVVDGLTVDPADIQVSKFRMSGFWDTPLDSILRNLGVQTLLFAGVNADQCVLCTLQDANSSATIACCSRIAPPPHRPPSAWRATLYNVRQCFGFVTRSEALLAGLPHSEP